MISGLSRDRLPALQRPSAYFPLIQFVFFLVPKIGARAHFYILRGIRTVGLLASLSATSFDLLIYFFVVITGNCEG